MENSVVNKIKDFAVKEFQTAYGYAGVAEGDEMIMINSGNDENIIMKITVEEN